MAEKREMIFKLVKSIIDLSSTTAEIKIFIDLLENNRSREFLLKSLSALADEYKTIMTNRIKPKERTTKLISHNEENLEELVLWLKNNEITSPILFAIVKEHFGKFVPVNKEGLGKYIRRLSKYSFFNDLKLYISKHLIGGADSDIDDPWLREMLNEQKKRERSDK